MLSIEGLRPRTSRAVTCFFIPVFGFFFFGLLVVVYCTSVVVEVGDDQMQVDDFFSCYASL
jgi:hypothetical protein